MADADNGTVYVDPLPADLPIAGPNEPLILWRGEVAVSDDSVTRHGQGRVEYRWSPRPALICTVDFSSLDTEFSLGNVRLDLASASGEARVGGGDYDIERQVQWRDFRIYSPIAIERGIDASEVRFLLVNLEVYYGDPIRLGALGWVAGRLSMRSERWVITVDEVDDIHAVENAARRSGGYAITHFCRATRLDEHPISSADAAELMTTLQTALSIAQGRWVTPIRPRGLTEGGDVAWELLGLWQTEPWHDPMSWHASNRTDDLDEIFRLIDDRWRDPYWERLLRRATHYYLDTVTGLVNRHMVMGVALLELVGWHIVVEERKLLSAEGFNRLDFADKIRLVMRLFNIDHEVSVEHTALKNWTKHRGWDAPKAIAEIRNGSVHAKRSADQWEMEPELWSDATQVLSHYCDVAMLGLLGYTGHYVNRVTARFAADAEPVPWSRD